VDINGNGQKIWKVTYTGGYCWLDGGGPWAGGDASYTGTVSTWNAIVTETYLGFVEVGTVRNHNATAKFDHYNDQCMSLSVTNIEKLDDTSGAALPADYPVFWDWVGCAPSGTTGEWGDVDSITMSIIGCVVATEQKSWGSVKAMYRD
jgi:hypothetical protein